MATLASIGDAVIVTGLDGRIILFNRVAESLTGWSESEAEGMPLKDVLLIHDEQTGDTVESPQIQALRENRRVELTDHILTAKDGRLTPIDTVAAPVKYEGGNVRGVVLVFRNVTARKEAEQAVLRSAEHFRRMADSAPVLIWMTGTDKRCRWFNKPWIEFTGRTMEQQIGDGWVENVHPDDLTRWYESYEACFDRRAPFEMEYRLRRPDGAYRWVLAHGTALHDRTGGFEGYIGSCVDITERKHAEDALVRANEDMKQFAFAVSHDLQEPLRVITSYSQLLLNASKAGNEEEGAMCVGAITEGTNRMQDLLSDLLSYTQIEAFEESSVMVDLNAILDKATENLRPAIERHEATVTSERLPSVYGNDTRLLQLFQNLIENAIKYRSNSPPLIHITVERVKEGWRLSVSDNGIGIDAEYHQRIFGVFKRLHGRTIPGTGIGLAICQKVVERYGGRIWVDSALNQGAKFYFTLPAAQGAHA